jgi:hypothetical protein
MKTGSVILIFLWSTIVCVGQFTCDIVTTGISTSLPVVAVGQSAGITLDVYNDNGESACNYAAGSVMVVVSLPADGILFQSFISLVSGPYFNWSYDPLNKVVIGINWRELGDGQGEVFSFNVTGAAILSNTYPQCRVINLAVMQNPDGPIFLSNFEGNDNGITTITIIPADGASTIECIDDADPPVPPFSSFCTPVIPIPTYIDQAVPLTCKILRTYTFLFNNCTGCPFSTFAWKFTYTIDDTTPPDWTTPPNDLNRTVLCDNPGALLAAQNLAPVAADNCGSVTYQKMAGVFVPGSCGAAGSFTNTWLAKDICLNTSMLYTQIITVTDIVPPFISLVGSVNVEICQGESYTDLGVTVMDNCDAGPITVVTDNPVDINIAGTYTITYNAQDECSNMAITQSRTVVVKPKPTGTISGTATVLQNNATFSTITFTGTGGTSPYTFTYTVNGGSVQTVVTASGSNIFTVAQSNSIAGVFVYSLLSVSDANGCMGLLQPQPVSNAIVTIVTGCDMSPTIPRPSNASYVEGEVKEGFVQFTNAGPGPTVGPLTFRISPVSNFDLIISPVMITSDGIPVQNSSALVNIAPGSFFTAITYTGVIPVGGNIRIGFMLGSIGLGGSTGNMTITIINGTGGDNNNFNNKAIRTYIINNQ